MLNHRSRSLPGRPRPVGMTIELTDESRNASASRARNGADAGRMKLPLRVSRASTLVMDAEATRLKNAFKKAVADVVGCQRIALLADSNVTVAFSMSG